MQIHRIRALHGLCKNHTKDLPDMNQNLVADASPHEVGSSISLNVKFECSECSHLLWRKNAYFR